MGNRAAWALLAPCVVLAAASAGTGGGASTPGAAPDAAPGSAADARAEHRQQRVRCQALRVNAVRTECLRQADRDLARRLGPAQPASPALPAASTATAPSPDRR